MGKIHLAVFFTACLTVSHTVSGLASTWMITANTYCEYLEIVEKIIFLNCYNLDDSSIQHVGKKFSGFRILRFYLLSPQFREFPKDIFKNMRIYEIVISSPYKTDSSEIETFHLFSSLNGSQDSLLSLQLFNTKVSNWELTSGSDFVRLRTLKVSNSIETKCFGPELATYLPDNIIVLDIKICAPNSVIATPSFAKFKKLRSIAVNHSQLTGIDRSFFPEPANSLVSISLKNMPIASLPDDVFSKMPNLHSLSLEGTKLSTLPYDVFHTALLGRKIKDKLLVSTSDIPLHCDCSLTWVKHNKLPDVIVDKEAKCHSPQHLEGRYLSNLEVEELCPIFYLFEIA